MQTKSARLDMDDELRNQYAPEAGSLLGNPRSCLVSCGWGCDRLLSKRCRFRASDASSATDLLCLSAKQSNDQNSLFSHALSSEWALSIETMLESDCFKIQLSRWRNKLLHL